MAPLFLSMLLLLVSPAFALAEEASHGGSGPSMSTLYSFINFTILVVALYKLLKQPLTDFFKARAEAIRQGVEEGSLVYAAALKQQEELKARLSRLEADSKMMMDSFKAEGEAERKRMLEQASALAQKIKDDAKRLADGEVKKGKEELREAAIALARELAERRLTQELKDDDQERLARGYVERMKRIH